MNPPFGRERFVPRFRRAHGFLDSFDTIDPLDRPPAPGPDTLHTLFFHTVVTKLFYREDRHLER
jgi:hypothetical protein